MWLRRSLSNYFNANKLSKALVAGTIFEPGYSARCTRRSKCKRAKNGKNRKIPATRLLTRRPTSRDNDSLFATSGSSGASSLVAPPAGRPRAAGRKRGMSPLDHAPHETGEPSFVPCHKRPGTALQHPPSASLRRTLRASFRNDDARTLWVE